jgi:hypothetical protein
MLTDGSHAFIDSHVLQHYQWQQIKLVKFSLLHAKNIRQDYGVPIWFSTADKHGHDVHFVRLLFYWAQRSQRRSSDPFLSYRNDRGLNCLLYKDIKLAVKESAAVLGLDKAWFDTHSVRMSAPTIARAVHAPTTVIMHMGRWQSLPAAMKYQE